MNGMIAQVVRGAGHLTPAFQQQLKRWLIETIQPMIEQHDVLASENASLRARVGLFEAMHPVDAMTPLAPMKRRPGRPRKSEAVSA